MQHTVKGLARVLIIGGVIRRRSRNRKGMGNLKTSCRVTSLVYSATAVLI